jgi:CRP/FNR family transcriptional regulator, dissimilatory nitrate respiration regulator
MCETQSGTTFDLQRVSLFQGLESSLLERLARAATCKEAKKGERIYWQGDTPQAFYFVVSGHVRRAIASPEGEEKVIDILSPGRYFSLAEIFGSSAYASFTEAVEPAVLLRIGKEGMLDAIAHSQSLALRLLEAVAEQQTTFERDVAACFFQSGCGRLVDYLLREAAPILQQEGDTILELAISKRLIAARIGVSAETLSRAFRELSEADLIAVQGKRIVLREKLALRQAARVDGGETVMGSPQWGRRQSDRWGERTRIAVAAASRALM